MTAHFYGLASVIKSGGVKLILWGQTSPLSEMMLSCKCFLHIKNWKTDFECAIPDPGYVLAGPLSNLRNNSWQA